MKFSLYPFTHENSISRNRFGHPVPRQPVHSPHPGWIWSLVQVNLFLPGFHDGVHPDRQSPSGQYRLYRWVTQVRRSFPISSIGTLIPPKPGFGGRWNEGVTRYFQHSHFIQIVSVGKRGAYQLVQQGDLDLSRKHPFGTTLRFTGPTMPANSRQ